MNGNTVLYQQNIEIFIAIEFTALPIDAFLVTTRLPSYDFS